MGALPKAGAHGLRCVVCRGVRDGPVGQIGDRKDDVVCFRCARAASKWLSAWAPVIRRYEKTANLHVTPAEWERGQKAVR